MKYLSKYLLRVKSKNTLSSCELVIRLRWVIIYATLVVKKEIYIYTEIYTYFFFSRNGLIVFVELFQVAMGWENWKSICKAMGIKLDKPKGKVIGKLGSVVWVYEELSKALWKINGQTFNLKFRGKKQLKFDPEYLRSSKQTSFNKHTKTLGYVRLFIRFSLALAAPKINALPLRKVIKIRCLFFSFFFFFLSMKTCFANRNILYWSQTSNPTSRSTLPICFVLSR